eukprot:TRINITY_DN11247_c0_g1_i2.p1 TRINITY_DN11247_c0_g1~~TRINITY_DN11247_c0_g1_i2.p1  ORF type:complete len:415 (+),score=78.15 TRINITY_DN11247_c0_g1_i2:36-1247(+)
MAATATSKLGIHGTCFSRSHHGVFGLGLPAEEDDDESDALKQFGINLSKDHSDGYSYRPQQVDRDESELVKIWDVPLLRQGTALTGIDMEKAYVCSMIENWQNEEVLFEIREGIAYVTLNRPEANNAMNAGLSAGVHDACAILRNRPDIRIAVWTGNGPMFCAGGDPKAFQASQRMAGVISSEEGASPLNPPGSHVVGAGLMLAQGNLNSAIQGALDFYAVAALPQFTICLMNGSAMGGGFGYVCTYDYVVAAKKAHATLSEVKLGVIPAVISPNVVRTIGSANCRRLFCTAENANMQTAMEIGLVHRIVEHPKDFPNVVQELATKIQQMAPGAVAVSKKTILDCLNQHITDDMMKHTASEYLKVRRSPQCEEGMESLRNKKRPPWVQATIEVKGLKENEGTK